MIFTFLAMSLLCPYFVHTLSILCEFVHTLSILCPYLSILCLYFCKYVYRLLETVGDCWTSFKSALRFVSDPKLHFPTVPNSQQQSYAYDFQVLADLSILCPYWFCPYLSILVHTFDLPKWENFQRTKLEFWKNLDVEYFILSRNQRELELSEIARKKEHFTFYCYRTYISLPVLPPTVLPQSTLVFFVSY